MTKSFFFVLWPFPQHFLHVCTAKKGLGVRLFNFAIIIQEFNMYACTYNHVTLSEEITLGLGHPHFVKYSGCKFTANACHTPMT